jgi:hypothetical protein
VLDYDQQNLTTVRKGCDMRAQLITMLMLNFDASVHYRVAIVPAERRSAGLEKVRHELTGAIDRHPQEDTCPL